MDLRGCMSGSYSRLLWLDSTIAPRQGIFEGAVSDCTMRPCAFTYRLGSTVTEIKHVVESVY